MRDATISLSSCARAATAAEARYRIDSPISPAPATRVVALDPSAEPALRRVAAQPWAHARFFSAQSAVAAVGQVDAAKPIPRVHLCTLDGLTTPLAEQLEGASGVVMLAREDSAAVVAAAIGAACSERGIMTVGLILGRAVHAQGVVAALRPHAQVLMVTEDEHDVVEVLTALRA